MTGVAAHNPSGHVDGGQRDTARRNHIPGESSMWFFVIGDLIIFGAYFVAYVYYRGRQPELFLESQNRVKSMALIHETLYQSSDLGLVDFGVYIRSLAEQVFHSYNILADRIGLQIQAEAVLLDTNQAIPCGLILNELLSNCLKHAFPSDRSGEVSIELWSDASRRVTLIVRDTGIGFPAQMDFRQTETIGLQLVCTLSEQLGGTLELDRHTGTAFKLSFTP